jgi:hypothetical protein
MPWKCKLIDKEQDRASGTQPKVGDMWFSPQMVEGEHSQYYLDHILSDEYKRDWLGKRAPLWVVFPSGTWMCVDQQYSGSSGAGWTVTGEAPDITVSPSINMVGVYHGFIQNGVITDDVEGRTFPRDDGD